MPPSSSAWTATRACLGSGRAVGFKECVLNVVLGLLILVAAVIVGVAGSTGMLYLYGIVVGALAMLGLSLLLTGARRASRRSRDSRRDLEQSRRETAAVSQQRDDLINRAEAAPPDTTEGQAKG